MSSGRFAGQIAVVVGAGAGIGRATALRLSQEQATLACLDRDGEAAGRTAKDVQRGQGIAVALSADVTDAASVQQAFDAVVERYGQVHAVVNCAGIQGPLGRRSHEVDLADVDATYAVNLRGALAVSQAALTHMIQHNYGRIAHVASIAGKEGNPNMIGYSLTKAGLIGMVKAQGKEYAEDGITVNALAPAVIGTEFISSQPTDVVAYMAEKIPMRRIGTVEECAAMLAWMLSPECSFTTGFTFDLSGGRATY